MQQYPVVALLTNCMTPHSVFTFYCSMRPTHKYTDAAPTSCAFLVVDVGTIRALAADQLLASDLPAWRSNTKNLDAQAAVLWGQVISAVHVSGYNLVKPPGARGASRDWVRDGMRMQRYASVGCLSSPILCLLTLLVMAMCALQFYPGHAHNAWHGKFAAFSCAQGRL